MVLKIKHEFSVKDADLVEQMSIFFEPEQEGGAGCCGLENCVDEASVARVVEASGLLRLAGPPLFALLAGLGGPASVRSLGCRPEGHVNRCCHLRTNVVNVRVLCVFAV